MKIKNHLSYIFVGVFFISLFSLKAADSTNAVHASEGWDAISNRWSIISIDKIKQSAESGDASAQCYLGRVYQIGNDVAQDYAEAARLYRLAADQGNAAAQNYLGNLYWRGHGVPLSAVEAVKWYQKSAEQGEVLGEKNLANVYASGAFDGVEPNHELAEEWMRKAVDLDSADGQYQFGALIWGEMNKELHQDTTRFPAAAEWFRKAADQGHAEAQYRLADMYNTGELGNDRRSNCIPFFLKAAANGNAKAKAEIGELPKLYPNNELLKSVDTVETLRQGAEQENLDAQFQLARRYQIGDGVPKDSVEAFKWMQKAAQQDQTKSSRVSDALYDLALMYEKGEGVTNDLSKAHDLFFQAAAGHHGKALFRVGQMYENGDGVPQDDHNAVEFYEGKFHNYLHPEIVGYTGSSPEGTESLFELWSQGRGFPTDQDKAEPGYYEPNYFLHVDDALITSAKTEFYLGEIYYQGKLIPKDLVEANALLHIAANQNFDDARNLLGQVEMEMSAAQKDTAKSRFDALEKQFEQAIKQEKILDDIRTSQGY